MMNIPRMALALALPVSVLLAGAAQSAETHPCEPFSDRNWSGSRRANTDVHNDSTKTLDVQIFRGTTIKKSVLLEPGERVRHKAKVKAGGGGEDILVRIGSQPSWSEGAACRYTFDIAGGLHWKLPEGASEVCPDVKGLEIACQVNSEGNLRTDFRVSDPN
jgi:hypothetical protein